MNYGWKNINGTGSLNCRCGSWKDHWVRFSHEPWPSVCSVADCTEKPILGAHVSNPNISGEKIVPMCDRCNKSNESFALKLGITLVSADTDETCDSFLLRR